ncbi:PLP-dependent aminotransferase family protein [Herbaspirillum lusitanum]|uniref:PLP-dependent aminotransferase family protein n=1 Tax=Herbaspirillum lusitanum TaxID=213312 RepID=A0ABW9A5F6_9BURK
MARRPKVVELPALGSLDRSAGNLARQLTVLLRDAVQRGDLIPGELLPSSRFLAQALEVARGTVVEAFSQLLAEGVLETKLGGGTSVASSLPPTPAKGKQARPRALATPLALTGRATQFAEVAALMHPLPHVPFAVSVPVGLAAPDDVWRRLGNKIRARGPGAPASYDDPQGIRVLREAIADYARRSRSVHCTAEQVIVTSGTQQGLYLSSQVLLEPGDLAWVEDPGYRGLSAILENTIGHRQMACIPVDEEGLDVAAGIRTNGAARVAFVTPSHQYPLGMPLSMARRSALLSWAQKHKAWIVEDDYDSELRYAGHPFPALQGMAPERVIYLGTFSKILFPSLRLGYAIVPPGLEKSFIGARILMDRHPPTADQHVLAAFMEEGHLDRHIRRIRNVYAERREQIIGLLHKHIRRSSAWLQPSDQGAHLVLLLAEHMNDRDVARAALKRGVSVRALSPMYSAGKARPGLILGLVDFPYEQLEAAVVALSKAIKSCA